ncbi:MAG: ribonuclease HII, partial [Salinimicrobium sediminis]|nr:ribonuclease HII [Salinimicrobium sediminis]
TATPKTLVSLSENELSIGKSSATLDFGLYTEPQIFYINNKIYVSVTDLQAHKVYLFDSNANLFPGFPVYGNSLVDLSNADDDTALELVVQGEENGVLIYSVSSAE